MHLFFFSVLLVLSFPFIMSDVVNSFNQCPDFFLKEKPPMIKGILEKSASQDNNRYKLICQKSKNIYRFATLYDTTNKIPVFSAYKYTGKEVEVKNNQKKQKTKRKWKIEQQLEETNDMNEQCVYQACSKDYLNQEDLTRGHILPMSYAADEDTAKSTCILTNIVPQKGSFNSGSWNRMEKEVKILMDTHCRDEKDSNSILAYVLTGAVPSQTNLLNNKVNIPSHMWTAFCCYNSKNKKWESQAYWAENIDESKDEGKTIRKRELMDVQVLLKREYNAEYTLFNGECLALLNANVNQPLEADSDDEQNDEEQSLLAYLMSLPAKLWAGLRNFLGI